MYSSSLLEEESIMVMVAPFAFAGLVFPEPVPFRQDRVAIKYGPLISTEGLKRKRRPFRAAACFKH